MDSTISPRFVTSILALLFCLAAWLHTGDAKPARIVTEVVGIAMVSPRAAIAAPAADPVAGVLRLAASGTGGAATEAMGPMSAERWQPLKAPAVPAARPVPADRPSTPQPSNLKPAAKAPAQVAHATAAARHRAGGKARPRTQRPPVLAQSAPPAPEVPALFMPLRRLGLSIQTKLPGSQARVAPAGKPADACADTAA
ncbi:hypothetical protein ACPWT1_22165 [Ramlibacter sp. MMS24-I3-19]|uniref:hypothetical protein n=1 Tax=Ramlibacter sp. MMS24-I3-19 TaxID=3416606 RepID=UPI003D053424